MSPCHNGSIASNQKRRDQSNAQLAATFKRLKFNSNSKLVAETQAVTTLNYALSLCQHPIITLPKSHYPITALGIKRTV